MDADEEDAGIYWYKIILSYLCLSVPSVVSFSLGFVEVRRVGLRNG